MMVVILVQLGIVLSTSIPSQSSQEFQEDEAREKRIKTSAKGSRNKDFRNSDRGNGTETKNLSTILLQEGYTKVNVITMDNATSQNTKEFPEETDRIARITLQDVERIKCRGKHSDCEGKNSNLNPDLKVFLIMKQICERNASLCDTYQKFAAKQIQIIKDIENDVAPLIELSPDQIKNFTSSFMLLSNNSIDVFQYSSNSSFNGNKNSETVLQKPQGDQPFTDIDRPNSSNINHEIIENNLSQSNLSDSNVSKQDFSSKSDNSTKEVKLSKLVKVIKIKKKRIPSNFQRNPDELSTSTSKSSKIAANNIPENIEPKLDDNFDDDIFIPYFKNDTISDTNYTEIDFTDELIIPAYLNNTPPKIEKRTCDSTKNKTGCSDKKLIKVEVTKSSSEVNLRLFDPDKDLEDKPKGNCTKCKNVQKTYNRAYQANQDSKLPEYIQYPNGRPENLTDEKLLEVNTSSERKTQKNDKPKVQSYNRKDRKLKLKNASDKIELTTAVEDYSEFSNDYEVIPGEFNNSGDKRSKLKIPKHEGVKKSKKSRTYVIAIISVVLISCILLILVAGIVVYKSHVRMEGFRPKILMTERTSSCATSENGSYLDDQCRVAYVNSNADLHRDLNEDVVSLDDSFLNSLESMTIQNLWADSTRHTRL